MCVIGKQANYVRSNMRCTLTIDMWRKSYNAPVAYHTIHHFVSEMRTHVRIGYLPDALWDL